MGFFSNIKNKARQQASSPVMPIAPVRQDTRVPLIPGMNPQVPFGLPDANGYYPGDDRYGGGFTRGPSLNPQVDYPPGKRPSSPRPQRPQPTLEELLASKPGLLSRAPQKRSGLSGLFSKLRDQQIPQQNLDFLSRLPQNIMPQVDFSNLPQMSGNPNIPAPDGYELREDEKGMNYFREQLSPEDQAQNMLPRRLDVRPGYAFGGPLMGGAKKFLGRNTPTNNLEAIRRQRLASTQLGGRTNKYFPDEFGNLPPTGIPSLRGASPLTDSLRRGTENLIIGGTGAGLAIGLDGTQELREPFSKDNISFMSPEAFGRDMAQLRMDVSAVGNLAKNKAIEMGENINDYVSRARSAYDQQMNQDMENKRMQEIDAQQGMQPFSALLGPNMPLTAPDGRPLSPIGIKMQEIINSGKKFFNPTEAGMRKSNPTIIEQQKLQNLEMQMEQQKAIDDMLSNLEKKN